jgi:hypothetical protein
MLDLRPSSPALALVLVLSALSGSCIFRKSPKPFTPPPPQTQPQIPETQPPIAAEPPKIAGEAKAPNVPSTIPDLPAPPAPKPQPKRGVVATTPPKPAAPAASEQPTPAPRLAQIFTPDEQRQYTRSIEESLERVRRNVALIARRTLTPEQTEKLSQITVFQKQAEQARDAQDLLTAVSLAQRADLLAQDLLNRLP